MQSQIKQDCVFLNNNITSPAIVNSENGLNPSHEYLKNKVIERHNETTVQTLTQSYVK